MQWSLRQPTGDPILWKASGSPGEWSRGDTLLGDVVISVETAARQAEEHHLSFNEELILLAIHGILHLLGYDHERSPQDARIMQDKTQVVFESLFPGRRPSGTSNF